MVPPFTFTVKYVGSEEPWRDSLEAVSITIVSRSSVLSLISLNMSASSVMFHRTRHSISVSWSGSRTAFVCCCISLFFLFFLLGRILTVPQLYDILPNRARALAGGTTNVINNLGFSGSGMSAFGTIIRSTLSHNYCTIERCQTPKFEVPVSRFIHISTT